MVFLYAGASALAGYETVNWGKKTLYDGARLNNGDAFVYGCAATLDMEVYLADFIALTASLRERFLWGGSMGVCHTEYGIGLVQVAVPGGEDAFFQGEPGEKPLVRFRCAHTGYTINISMARD